MLSLSFTSELPDGFPATAVAIGKFDGLHLGHQQLIHELVEYAHESELAPAVVTFDRHPMALFDPVNCPKSILGQTQKARLIEKLGVEVLLTLEFDRALSQLSPEEFVVNHLVPLGASMVFVGENFSFGAGGEGTFSDLRDLGAKYGFRAREVAHVELAGKKISSTDIRTALELGKVELASLLLGRNHEVTGVIEHGKKLGRTFGFPTANFSRNSEGYLPQDGIYAGYLLVDGEAMPAAHSVGTNDSVAEVPRLLESHVIGRDDLDLYDREATAVFVAQVRGWQKFDSLDDLIEQIGKDVQVAANLLGE